MTLLIILLSCIIWWALFIQKTDIFEAGLFCLLTSAAFLFYSLLHSAAYEGKYTEQSELNISSIAINGPEFWVYTKDGVIRAINPQISEEPSKKFTILYPQKWWLINLGISREVININIEDLYEKRIPHKLEKEL